MKLLFLLLLISSFTIAYSQTTEWAEIEEVFGRKGAVQGEVFKIAFPRADLNVKVGEINIEPALALTSWIAFKKMENHTMMG